MAGCCPAKRIAATCPRQRPSKYLLQVHCKVMTPEAYSNDEEECYCLCAGRTAFRSWIFAGAVADGRGPDGRQSHAGRKSPAQCPGGITNADTDKSYKTKTDKKGEFALLGVPYGNYQIEVFGEKGEKLFTAEDLSRHGQHVQQQHTEYRCSQGRRVRPDNKFGVPDPPAPSSPKSNWPKSKRTTRRLRA